MGSATHERFHLQSLEQLRAAIRELGLSMPVGEDVSILNAPVELAGRSLPNCFVAQPMEGFDALPDGSPGELAFRRYRRYVEGGISLVWVEATAVLVEGRSNPGQFCLHAGSVEGFRSLATMMRETAKREHGRDVMLVMQLTHSGRYSKPTGKPSPIIAHHSPILDPQHGLPADYPLVTDAYLDELQGVFVKAAQLARDAGFDGVDVKSCHRYLVSELLASFTREGRYGGSFENRTRFLRETMARIREAVPGLLVTTRMNAFDAIPHPYGWGVDAEDETRPDLSEPLALARALSDDGLELLNISIGNPYFNPHYGRPYDFPIRGGDVPAEHPLVGLDRFMTITRQFQEALGPVAVVASGYTWLRQFMPNVAAEVLKTGGATLLGIGRGAFAYPDCVKDLENQGRMDPAKCCVTCSACTQLMRDGTTTGCVVRDSEIYGPIYRMARRFDVDRLREEARRCRDCETATCTAGCPAAVNVPAFIKAFAENDIQGAYDVLREANLLPEMCARVCPSEVQCEGGCVESTFCGSPVPIRDIQLVVCRAAREQGLIGVRLPEKTSGKRMAVVGGGPTGLAAAIRLLELGHQVVVVDRAKRLGGTPEEIIPSARLSDALPEVDAILKPALEAGRLELRLGQGLGEDLDLASLADGHDGVLLAMGLSASSMSLGKADGVTDALTFLRQAKSRAWGEIPDRVAVLGGGNTAMDAAVVARGLGARDVYLVYRRSFDEMPAWPTERDTFMNTGGHLLLLTQPLGYETDAGGKLTGLRIARTALGAPDASGRRRPQVVAGSESILAVDLVIEAMGQGMPESLQQLLEKENLLSDRGLIQTAGNGSFATGVDRVYAAGDLVNGGTTAVQGIAEGMRAAEEMGGE